MIKTALDGYTFNQQNRIYLRSDDRMFYITGMIKGDKINHIISAQYGLAYANEQFAEYVNRVKKEELNYV